MKKYIYSLIMLVLLSTALAGCGSSPEAVDTAAWGTASAADVSDGIHTVDDFLNALGSDREITLAPGIYDLTEASDYGRADESQP